MDVGTKEHTLKRDEWTEKTMLPTVFLFDREADLSGINSGPEVDGWFIHDKA